jgi:AcrR family transcriptional regulator
MKRGERASNRTRTAIKQALLEQMRQQNYPDVKVGDITQQANVGRSTFYNHYPSKAQVLVDIHKDMFERIFNVLDSQESWLMKQPPAEWILFLKNYQRLGRNPFLLSYKLGTDLDFLITHISQQLSRTIEARLKGTFSGDYFRIPVPIIAEAVAASFSGLIMSWFIKFQSVDAAEFAGYIQQGIRALIREWGLGGDLVNVGPLT